MSTNIIYCVWVYARPAILQRVFVLIRVVSFLPDYILPFLKIVKGEDEETKLNGGYKKIYNKKLQGRRLQSERYMRDQNERQNINSVA